VGGQVRARGAATGFAVLVLATAGCGSIAERATESALGAMSDGEVDLDLDGGGMSIEGPDGESLSFGASSDVPDAIADVVDVPDGFEPTNVVEHSEGERMSTTVVGTVDTADPVALIEGIEAGLADDGWEREGFSNTNNQMVLVAMSRGEDENLNVTVLTDDAEAMLTIIYVRPT
jgi:hypothetical protein